MKRKTVCGLIHTMDIEELEKIRQHKKLLEKQGKLPGQGMRTPLEDYLFFKSRIRLCLPLGKPLRYF